MSQVQESNQSARPGISKAGLIAGLIFLAAGLLVFYQSSLSYILVRTQGVYTQGVIEKLIASKVDYFDSGVAENLVDYSFVLSNGKVVQGHTQLSDADWHSLRVGQQVSVKFVSSFPRYNYLADYQLWEVNIIVMIIFPVVFAGIGCYILLKTLLAKKTQS